MAPRLGSVWDLEALRHPVLDVQVTAPLSVIEIHPGDKMQQIKIHPCIPTEFFCSSREDHSLILPHTG